MKHNPACHINERVVGRKKNDKIGAFDDGDGLQHQIAGQDPKHRDHGYLEHQIVLEAFWLDPLILLIGHHVKAFDRIDHKLVQTLRSLLGSFTWLLRRPLTAFTIQQIDQYIKRIHQSQKAGGGPHDQITKWTTIVAQVVYCVIRVGRVELAFIVDKKRMSQTINHE